jgi:hypothetical protein
MTSNPERPWRRARRFFEENFKEETFAETVLKNFEDGFIYSDANCFVLAQEAATDGLNLDYTKKPNAWYVQLAVAGSGNTKIADIVRPLPRGDKEFICYHRGTRSEDLRCYGWDRFFGKVGI